MLTLCRRSLLFKNNLSYSLSISTHQCARSFATEAHPAKEESSYWIICIILVIIFGCRNHQQSLTIIISKGIFNKKEAQSVKGRSASSTQWLQRKFNDKFTRKAHDENLISRAAFKLQEIQRKFRIIKRGNIVLDLGAAPGGWSQIASRLCVYSSEKKKELEKDEDERMSKGQVISVDIKEMEPIKGCICLKLDFTEDSAVNTINLMLRGRSTNVVLSDMAPSYSGQKDIDHMRLMDLSTRAFEFARKVLKPGGHIVLKVSRGGTESKLKKQLEAYFRKVQYFKPESSFKDSTEIYLVGIGFKKAKKGQNDDGYQFKYTSVPNTGVDQFDQTLTEKSKPADPLTTTQKPITIDTKPMNSISKEDNKTQANTKPTNEAPVTQVHPQQKSAERRQEKRQEKYKIDKLFGYKKLI